MQRCDSGPDLDDRFKLCEKLPTMGKKFALAAAQIKPLVTNRGGCIATDLITVGGQKVGYMIRDKPDNSIDVSA